MNASLFPERPAPVLGKVDSYNFQYLNHPHDREVVSEQVLRAAALVGLTAEPADVLAFYDAARRLDSGQIARSAELLGKNGAIVSAEVPDGWACESGRSDGVRASVTVRNANEPAAALMLSTVSFEPRHPWYGEGLIELVAQRSKDG